MLACTEEVEKVFGEEVSARRGLLRIAHMQV
jgi:hypothetical protein